MERNIKLVLQYDGTRYDGWQKQGNTENTIQGKLEAVVLKMTGEPVEVVGSGRTDAGVHAWGQVANFHLPESYPGVKDADSIKDYINRYLPEDIRVLDAKEVNQRFHSRLNAVQKTYVYQVETGEKKDVFLRKYMFGVGKPLNIKQMEKAASLLIGTHDFKGFSSAKKTKKSTVRTLFEIKIEKQGTRVTFTYIGNGFLYNMVRILTGTLIQVGLGQQKADSVAAILESKDRQKAGFTAPAEGLFLADVRYPENTF